MVDKKTFGSRHCEKMRSIDVAISFFRFLRPSKRITNIIFIKHFGKFNNLLKEIATGLMPLAMTITIFFTLITTPLMATAPSEELSYIDIAHNAEYLEVFRVFDGKKYKMRIGIGCMPALFDDLSKDTKIYAVKLGDLLNPYGDGDMGLVYIETPHHKVRCKIIDMQPF